MRFTKITGKAKQYVTDNFIVSLDAKLTESIDYLQHGKNIYHVPTIRGELVEYLVRYSNKNIEQNEANKNLIGNVLGRSTWEDVFNSKTVEELLFPVKLESQSI